MSATEAPSDDATNAGTKFATSRNEKTLDGRTVLVIGGTAGIGLETARLARAHGADLILIARNADQLNSVGARTRGPHGGLRCHRLHPPQAVLRRVVHTGRPCAADGPGPTTPPCRTSISTKHGETWKPISSCLSRSLNVPLERFARQGPCCS